MPDAIIPPQPATPVAGENSTSDGAQPTKAADSTAGSIKALEGKTTVDDKMVVEAQILAYSAVRLIAEQIAKDFAGAFPHAKKDQPGDTAQTSTTAIDGQKATTGASEQAKADADAVLAKSAVVQAEGGQTTNPAVVPCNGGTCRYCVIVLDETLIPALATYKALLATLNLVSASFKSLIPSETTKLPSAAEVPPPAARALVLPAALAGISTASALGRSAVDLLSLFRQDTAYSGRAFAINSNALVLEVLRALRAGRKDVTCIYPKLMPQGAVHTEDGDQPLQTRLQSVLTLRDRAHDELCKVQEQFLQLRMNASSDETDVAQLAKKRTKLESTQAAYTAANSRLEKILSELQTTGDDGLTQMEKVQKAEEILGRFGSRSEGRQSEDRQSEDRQQVKPLFLHVEAVSIAGGYRTRSNLWRTLFNSDGLSYSGGAIITYAFINCNAEIEVCGTHRYRTPFVRFNDKKEEQTNVNSFCEKQPLS